MAILLLFLVLILVFSIPAVQTSAAHKLTDKLNTAYGTNIDLKKIRLSYNGKVVLDSVFIADHHQDTLISAREVRTSLMNLPALLSGSQLDFGSTTVDNLKVRIRRYAGEESDNISIFTEKFSTGKPPSNQNFQVFVSHIIATNSKISYVNENNATPEILSFTNLNIDASDLHTDGPDVSVHIENMNGLEASGLQVEHFSTQFTYNLKKMEFADLELQTPNSSLEGNVVFSYDNREDFADFVNKVRIDATFDQSSVSTEDLKLFYNEFGIEQNIDFSGKLAGSLNNFDLNDFEMHGMDRSVLRGNLNLKGVFSDGGKDFKVSGDFDKLATNYYDLTNLLPNILGKKLPQKLKEIGSIDLSGELSATTNEVVTHANVRTQLGNARLDVTLDNLNNFDFATYNGNLIFKSFNLGRFLGNPDLGKVTLNLDLDGVGFTTKTLNTNLKGTIEKLRFNGYTYKNIEVVGVLKNPLFNGKLVSHDPNLQFSFDGLIDVAKETNVYDFEANIDYADLNAINLIQRDSVSIFKGSVNMNMRGTNLDDAVGKIQLQNASYKNGKGDYEFEELTITSSFDGKERTIVVNSPDIISGEVVGDFKLADIPAIFENAVGSLYANYKPLKIASDQYLDFNFDIYNKIVEVVLPDIELAPNTFIRGSVASSDSEFKLTFRSPKINAFNNMFEKVNLQVDNTNPLFNTYLEVDSIATSAYDFSKFSLINVTLNDTLFIRSEFKGGKNNNDVFNLSLYHTINKENKSVLGIRKSNIKFKESTWYLNEKNEKDNVIVFDDNLRDITLDTLVLSNKDQEIRLNGEKRDSTYKNFKLNFTNVDLEKITPDLDSLKLSGKVNGKLNLRQEKGVYLPSSSLTIQNLGLNGTEYGKLTLDIQGNKSLTQYNVKALLGNEKRDFLKASGNIDVGRKDSNINMNVVVDQFDMAGFSAIGGAVISNIHGLVSGRAKVMGDYKNPDISGRLTLEKAGVKIPYLNVDLDFKDQSTVDLSNQQFKFNDIPVEDTKYHTKGTIGGTISHHNFRDWELNLNLQAPERLLVLDTPETEDALYYGTGFISGDATLKGPTDELVIRVNATTEKGTVFKIPLNDIETIGDNSFIYFITQEEKLARQQGKQIKLKEVKGLELFFDLDVTSDAEVEVVVDKKSGSSLRGSGAGTLLMEINTNGKFNMWGDFVVYQGVYNFKYAGLVQKEFEVVSGGSINWDGSPTRANLNVRALYKTNANPAVLLENPTINRNIPVNVYINLNGELTEADISFDIEYPNLSSVVKSELEYRLSDRQNVELQALSLISQGSFYGQYASGQNAPGNLLFERASGLFNDIFSDDDGKFKVGINYVQGQRTPERDNADRFGVTLSTQISKRILLNGRVGVPVGGYSESVVVGNVEIELLLNKEGTLRANLFNRESNIQYIGEELGYTQGVGLSYAVDFDTFRELIRKILNKEMKVEDVSEKVEKSEAKSLAPDYIQFPGEN